MKKNYWTLAIIIYLLIYTAICFITAVYTNFHVSLNDFWGNLFMAKHLDINLPGSFYNGFYPIGYTIYLKVLSLGDPITLAYTTNIIWGIVMLSSIAYLCSITVGNKWALLCTIVLSLLPTIFSYITLPGTDIGATAFITLGGVLLIISTSVSDERKSLRLLVIGVILCGISALWRYHFLVLSFGLVLGISIISKHSLRRFLFGFTSLIIVYGIQITVNIFSGHGLFETSSSFNVYKQTSDIDWQHISEIKSTIPKSVLGVIFSSPVNFFMGYISVIQEFLHLFIPGILGIFLLEEKKFRRISLFFSLAFLLYIPVVTMGVSERAVIPLLPFVVYQTIILSKFIYESALKHFNERRLEILSAFTILFIIVGFLLSSFLIENIKIVDWRKNKNKDFLSIEKVLVKNGVSDAKQVFSNDFDLYFPNLKTYRPFTNGDWERYDLFGYNEEFPEVSVQDLEEFLNDCNTHSINYLVLDAQYGLLSDAISRIYNEEIELKSIIKIGEINDFKIFKIEPE